MDKKVLHRAFGILAFVMSFVTYFMTAQPSVPFWDCGEFSAAVIWQQVPHPPGTPLFMIVGKLFHLLLPFLDQGLRINVLSVTASAFTILLVYLIGVMIIENFRKEGINNFGEAMAVYGAAFIGAAAFTFSDSFWFNAVESEVYASSSFFAAIVVYLMMKWNEKADEPGHEKYLVLIAYLLGLSTGIHLLALLAIISIVFVVYFRKYDIDLKKFAIYMLIFSGVASVLFLMYALGISSIILGVIAIAIWAYFNFKSNKNESTTFVNMIYMAGFAFFIIYPGIVKYLPVLLAGNVPFKNEAREYLFNSNLLRVTPIFAVVGLAYMLWAGFKKKNELLKIFSLSILFALLGYTTYTHTLLRSNANPPLNENEPKDFTELARYIGREQYGEAPIWPRRYQTEDYFIQCYEKKDKNGDYVYGPWIQPGRKEVTRNDGSQISLPDFKETNVAGELTYMWKYQIDHMMLRYLFWNFVGKKSDVQDAEAAWFDKKDVDELNYKSGYAAEFPIRFFALPLILGLIGMFFHFYRDPKMAFAYMTMFFLSGIAAALQQNQQEPQPRERDYFYCGAFMVYAIWIGLGAYGIIETMSKSKNLTKPATAFGLALSMLIAPLNMALGGWRTHSRAGDYIPFDYSYNILQSTEKDAILFTNGDNDTFPLWYLQDVEGVRRDVRIVNLSLGNTLWYVDELKNREPWGAKKIPLTFSDESIKLRDEMNDKALSYDFGETRQVVIPVKREILAKYTNDPAVLAEGVFKATFLGKPYGERDGKQMNLYRVQDKVILDILQQTKFERPVYFSNTVGPDAFCGLDQFFRMEGMALRICPVPQRSERGEPMDAKIMEQCLMQVDNSQNFSREPKYGFKMRNLNNMNVYYDEVHRRLMTTYRQLYISYAEYCLKEQNDKAKAASVLNKMNELISPVQFPMTFENEYRIAKIYDETDAKAETKKFAEMGIKSCLDVVDKGIKQEYAMYEILGRYVGPYRYAAQMYEMLGDYNNAKAILEKLKATAIQVRQQYQSEGASQDVMRINTNIADVSAGIDELRINQLARAGETRKALELSIQIAEEYKKAGDQVHMYGLRIIEKRMTELENKLGIKRSVDSSKALAKGN